MSLPGGSQREEGRDLPQADARVLGQLLAAQNFLSVLPTRKHVADFYARALASVPGVSVARVCLPGASSQEGAFGLEACADCERLRKAQLESGADASFPDCALRETQGLCTIGLRTASSRFGFFVLCVDAGEVFEPYRPFIVNLGNFLSLALENRLQGDRLRRARDALELRVEARTEELRSANRKLEKEIAERKRAEAATRELNLELERRVRDRTTQLEEANRELEAFAYSVSHDLRAPLRHASGFLELLEKRAANALDAKGKHYLTSASDAAARMGRLIDDLLSFSRAGRGELARTPVDLAALVRETIRELELETRNRAIRWEVGELPVVAGDGPMLRQVLVNLLSNAVKFTRTRASAEIEIGSETGSGDERVVFVRDNGVGFDPKYADKLFGVFQRLHSASEFEGTGVGLANVRRIIARHGGRTWAEGGVDRGAAFFFSLPRLAPGQG